MSVPLALSTDLQKMSNPFETAKSRLGHKILGIVELLKVGVFYVFDKKKSAMMGNISTI